MPPVSPSVAVRPLLEVDASAISSEANKVNPTQRQMLKHLQRLGEGTSMCPGSLARECGSRLAAVRADLLALAKAGKIVLSQGGRKVRGEKIRGPFRVASARKGTP